jgi:uncharacterized protein YcbK (DUF882 family)
MGDTPRRDAPISSLLTRRSLLHLSGAAVASSILAPLPALAAIASRPERSLQLHLAHTGETFAGKYWVEGHYIPEAVRSISELMRDQHTDQVRPMDPRLLDLLHTLQSQSGIRQPIEVVCGYRSAATNALLREEGERGVAKHSYHITGQAVDVRLRDGNLRQLYNAARALGAGGVGYYGHAHFVHVDVGEVRHWEIGGAPTHSIRPRSRPRSTRQS